MDPSSSSKPSQSERRTQSDRREADRQGKYDRRRNRCVHCRFFGERPDKSQGFCNYHETPMAAFAFACTFFKPIEGKESKEG